MCYNPDDAVAMLRSCDDSDSIVEILLNIIIFAPHYDVDDRREIVRAVKEKEQYEHICTQF